MDIIHTINLSDNNEEIITVLKNIVDESKELELKTIELNSRKVLISQNKKDEVDLKKNKRGDILKHREDIESRRHTEYLEARERRNSAYKKFTKRASESKQLEETIENSKRLKGKAEENLKLLNEESTERSLEIKAEILAFEKENISTDTPIKLYSPSPRKKQIMWQTNDVFIRDTCGKPLDFNFGKFLVAVTLEENYG